MLPGECLTNEFVDRKDRRDESNVEQKEQPSNRKSNHCHILTNTNAALCAQICSEAKNRKQPSSETTASDSDRPCLKELD